MIERIAFRAYPSQLKKLKAFCKSNHTKPGKLFRSFIDSLEKVDSGQTLAGGLPRRYQCETHKTSNR
jgi:hypothetical protein